MNLNNIDTGLYVPAGTYPDQDKDSAWVCFFVSYLFWRTIFELWPEQPTQPAFKTHPLTQMTLKETPEFQQAQGTPIEM